MSADEVERLYESVTDALTAHYGSHIHVGYEDHGHAGGSLAEATQRLTDEVIERLGAGPGQRVLDVGCGTGGPALRLAEIRGVSVTGVTVSRRQVVRARAASRALGLAGRVRFAYADAAVLPHADARFDAAYAIESMTHMEHKDRVLAELARVLRPGGRLVIADGILHAPHGAAARRAVEEISVLCGGHPPPTLRGYRELLGAAGLDLVAVADVSKQTRRTLPLMTAAVEAAAADAPEEARAILGGFAAAFGMIEKVPELGYALLTAERVS
jgi:cyclopropane fatty-acyl-phospholipid synthase-like methyltransferase